MFGVTDLLLYAALSACHGAFYSNSMAGGTYSLGLAHMFVSSTVTLFRARALNQSVVFSASEHLCSDEANKPLQGRYFWPVDSILGSREEAEDVKRSKSD